MARGDLKFYQFLLNGFPIILLFFFALTGYSFSFNIFKIKKRPKRFPLILFTHSIAEAKKLAIFSPFEEYLASKYWPGPLTLILKKKGKKFYNGDKRLSKVGIRIPKNKDVIKILEYIQKPLATTSANIHGEINIKSLNQLGR